ncbi:MAG: hypothetical protein VXV96_16750 [Bdellovibrionota bacterium]|nr:hypothetical protein [Bdellovibrionota bacterium]
MAKDINIKGVNRNSLIHDLRANELRILLEKLKLGKGFISGFYLRSKMSSGISPCSREKDTIPDWICAIKTRAGVKNVALECELNYKGKRRMEYVFDSYESKKSIHFVWYVVSKLSFRKKILDCFESRERTRGDHFCGFRHSMSSFVTSIG